MILTDKNADYKYSMNGWSQVFKGVEFNCIDSRARRPSCHASNLTNAAAAKQKKGWNNDYRI